MAKTIIYLLWAALAFGWVYLGHASAKTAVDTQLTIARAAVGECGWKMPDCTAALWHTLARRRTHVAERIPGYSLRKMFLQYCAIFKGRSEGRKRWVRGLRADAASPSGWTSGASWGKHMGRWQKVYARAGDFLQGNVPDPCKGKPVHTGSIVDAARMSPHRWQIVDCGVTRDQIFWERKP